MIQFEASILSADLVNLEDQVRAVVDAGIDGIQIDVMDGRFVPPITFGDNIVRAIRRVTDTLLDVHLMIVEPEKQIEAFVEAGANRIFVHQEACLHLHSAIKLIKEQGVKAGVSLNPATPLSAIEEIIPHVDLILIMSVNPGFGGQSFIPATLPKITNLRKILDDRKLNAELEVDGGVTADNAPGIVKAGANVLVAGNSIFKAKEGISRALRRLREATS